MTICKQGAIAAAVTWTLSQHKGLVNALSSRDTPSPAARAHLCGAVPHAVLLRRQLRYKGVYGTWQAGGAGGGVALRQARQAALRGSSVVRQQF